MAVTRLGTKDLINRRDAKDAKEKKIGHRFTQIKHRLKLFFNPKNLRSSVSKSSLLFSSLRSLCLCGERGFIISYTLNSLNNFSQSVYPVRNRTLKSFAIPLDVRISNGIQGGVSNGVYYPQLS